MAAITMTIAQVRFATGIGTLSDTDGLASAPWAAALVEKYAPGAPDGVKLEAAMRCLGWWTQSPAWPVSSQKLGETSVDYALHKLNPLLHSGASMILSPFRTNTMGVV